MVMRRKQKKENRHCRVNMIKEHRITIYEHRIFSIFHIIISFFPFFFTVERFALVSFEKFT